MVDGWVKLWRKSIDSGLIKNHNVWIFWTYCLMKANHKKDHKQVVGFQEIILQPGQFIFGRKKAAEETGLSERNIRTCLSFLKKYKNLTIKATNKFSIVSIMNWETYQKNDGLPDQQSDQQVTSNRPAGDHKQEHKNKRKEIYSRVISYLNRKTGKNFRTSGKKTKSLIDSRLNEGFKPEDFKTVIDNKVADSKNDEFDEKYLRPETLFGTKFESYLNQKPVNGKNLTDEEIREKYGVS